MQSGRAREVEGMRPQILPFRVAVWMQVTVYKLKTNNTLYLHRVSFTFSSTLQFIIFQTRI